MFVKIRLKLFSNPVFKFGVCSTTGVDMILAKIKIRTRLESQITRLREREIFYNSNFFPCTVTDGETQYKIKTHFCSKGYCVRDEESVCLSVCPFRPSDVHSICTNVASKKFDFRFFSKCKIRQTVVTLILHNVDLIAHWATLPCWCNLVEDDDL